MKKVTSFTHHTTAEGERVTFTYSVIDESSGQLLKSNERSTMVVFDDNVLSAIRTISKFLTERIEAE